MKRFALVMSVVVCLNTLAVDDRFQEYLAPNPVHLVAHNVDDLVIQGVDQINKNGERFTANAGDGKQAYGVSYSLLDPLNKVHNLRAPRSTRYFARELLAYCRGSLKVEEGLAQAAPMWKSLADDNGEICSNYGYYVFHQKVPEFEDQTQYEWVMTQLARNLDTRKAFININQTDHKRRLSKDFPCTLGMQFFVRQDKLCCTVSSRSTDIYTGLPYDIGFFAFVTELVCKDLKERCPKKTQKLGLGYVTMATSFTQIYDKTSAQALALLSKEGKRYETDMPEIGDAAATLRDIYDQTYTTPVMKWIYNNAELGK